MPGLYSFYNSQCSYFLFFLTQCEYFIIVLFYVFKLSAQLCAVSLSLSASVCNFFVSVELLYDFWSNWGKCFIISLSPGASLFFKLLV